MPLPPGSRLGPYEILSLLGAGGMGEVYRARDTRLKRDVALKILRESVATDPDRLTRFQREAEVLASLNHPHIAAIHGVVDESGHVTALALELVEGETLAERLSRGAIPLDETLAIATQMAAALESAHDRGIVHRDLKPANIKVRDDGTVKVLDFGLAKLVSPESGSADTPATSQSPTLATPPVTGAGVIVGTVAYMAPEQARGRPVDKRADIWAFGCIVFEMLSGVRPFDGETLTDVLAAIITNEPDWSRLPAHTPAAVRSLLAHCLQKDPLRRLRDIADGRFRIVEATNPDVPAAATAPTVRRRERLAWLGAMALMMLLAGAAWTMRGSRGAAAEVRLEIMTPPTSRPAALAMSPDGRTLTFVGTSDGKSRLWLRRLNDATAQVLLGTEDASNPFWSPDGRSIGFSVGAELKRIDLESGAIQTIGRDMSIFGGTWLEDDTILATPTAASPMYRIPSSGGQAIAVTQVNGRETGHRFPQLLPDGRHFLCFAGGTEAGIYIGTLGDISTRKILDASAAAYVATGHLLFVRQGDLFAQRFDATRLEVTGAPTLIAQDIVPGSIEGSAALSVSAAGPIVYRAGGAGVDRQLRWVDREGRELETLRGTEDMGGTAVSLSADNTFVAWTRGAGDLFLLELARGVSTRFTFEPSIEIDPVWTPDGRRLAYSANADGDFDLYVKSTSGPRGGAQRIRAAGAQFANAWSPDGQFVLYSTNVPASRNVRPSASTRPPMQIWALPVDGTRTPFPVVDNPGVAASAEFSPHGSWIAFQSDESGRFEIYAQPFPSGDKVQISTAGGVQPRWRPDGKELFYLGPDNRLMAVPVDFATRGRAPSIGAPVSLFTHRWSLVPQAANLRNYAVSRDGRRFLVDVLSETATPVTVILNWQPKD